MTDDPFEDEGVPRDGRGRPLIIPAGRAGKPNTKTKPVAYTRASTFAKALDDSEGLVKWKARHAAVGIANSPDLAAMLAALGRNPDQFSRDDKQNVDAIIERAHDRSGGNEKADYGTAVHTLTEPGRDPFADALPAGMLADARAFELLLDKLDAEIVDTETFVVNDDVKVAGTFDHTIRLRSPLTVGDGEVIPAGTVLVIDKKTGSLHLGQHAIQLATYARGRKYDHLTGERAALDVSPQWGIVAHVPKGQGKAVAYLVDLHAGWKAAKLAVDVRAYRSGERRLGTVVADVESDGPDEPTPAPAAQPATSTVVVPLGTDRDPFDTPDPWVDPDDAAQGGPVIEDAEHPLAESEIERDFVAAVNEDVQALAAVTGKPPLGGDVVEVDEFGDPINPAPAGLPSEADAAQAMANLARAGMLDKEQPDAILAEIARAGSDQECRAIWSRYARIGAWHDKHTEAVVARLAELKAAA